MDQQLMLQYPGATAIGLIVLMTLLTIACYFGWQGSAAPAESALVSVTGEVSHVRTTSPAARDLVFRMGTSSIEYRYLDWYPNFSLVRDALAVGRPVTVAALPGDGQVWGLRSGRRELVSFTEMAAARGGNGRIAYYLMIAWPILTVIGLIDLWRKSIRPVPTFPPASAEEA